MNRDVDGFHDGELLVQDRAGVRADAARLARMLDPADLRGGAAGFLSERTLAAITARDPSGLLWTSLLVGPPGFLEANGTTLQIVRVPRAGDPLHWIAAGQPVGLVAIDFATRRRLRINGTLTAAGPDSLVVEVEQAYGNCPQYIQQRYVEVMSSAAAARGGVETTVSARISAKQARFICRADTFFLGTTHPDRGIDTSHRGGTVGFVRVDGKALWWPDYVGNNMFNSLGIWPLTTPRRCCSLTSSRVVPCICQAPHRPAGSTRAPRAMTPAPDVESRLRRARSWTGKALALRASAPVPSRYNPPLR